MLQNYGGVSRFSFSAVVKRTRTLVLSLCLNFVSLRLHIIIAALGRVFTVPTEALVPRANGCEP